MPRPKYILCAESISQDKATNLVSFFHVLEGFTVSAIPQDAPSGQSPVPSVIRFTCVAVWERTESDDPTQLLDYEVTVAFPEDEPRVASRGQFKMEKKYQRFTTIVVAPGLPQLVSGDVVLTSKVKSPGATAWLSQEYRVPIHVVQAPSAIQER